jgi:hypothetical protein
MGKAEDLLADLAPDGADAAEPDEAKEGEDEAGPSRLEVLARGADFYREKYLRIAHMIAKSAVGLAGMNDDVPPMDDLIRAREYFEEMERAYLAARRAED